MVHSLLVISVADLNDLIAHQFALFAWLEDNPEILQAERSPLDEENRAHIEINGEPWSYSLYHHEVEFTARLSGRTVVINRSQRSPFEFNVRSLLRFLLTKYEQSRLNDVVVENWIVRQVPSGRVVRSDYTPGFFALH